jgi:hypothetical protein
MMAGIALAFAAAILPAPAFAQSGARPAADHDAMCFIAMTALLGRLTDKPDQAPADMPKRLQRGIGFYTGRLTQRYPGAELAAQVKGAGPALFAMTFRQQMDLIDECTRVFDAAFARLVVAVDIK